WMAKKIIFHGGFQKTGSTTLQHRVVANMDVLGGKIFYQGKRETRDLKTWCQRLLKKRDKQKRKKLTTALQEVLVRFERSGRPAMLISSEILFNNDLYDDTGDMLLWIELVMPVVAAAFADYDVDYVFYTRQEDRWLQSNYKQSVLMRGYTVSYADFKAGVPFPLDWAEIKARIEATVHPASVHFVDMFEDIGHPAGIGAYIFGLAGVSDVDMRKLTHAPQENVSLDATALEIQRRANILAWPKPRLTLLGNALKEIQALDEAEHSAADDPVVEKAISSVQDVASALMKPGSAAVDLGEAPLVSAAQTGGWGPARMRLLNGILEQVARFDPDEYEDETAKVVRQLNRQFVMALRHVISPEMTRKAQRAALAAEQA
ncbi:MAG: hypothetical protein AAF401_10745, partial [Pseudomonadota bacterium]